MVSAERLLARQANLPFMRDRIEEADRDFFARVAQGYEAILAAEPDRVIPIESIGAVEQIEARIWHVIKGKLAHFSTPNTA